MRSAGVDMEIELVRHGFYPAGGGEIVARVRPASALHPFELVTRPAPPTGRSRLTAAAQTA